MATCERCRVRCALLGSAAVAVRQCLQGGEGLNPGRLVARDYRSPNTDMRPVKPVGVRVGELERGVWGDGAEPNETVTDAMAPVTGP